MGYVRNALQNLVEKPELNRPPMRIILNRILKK